MKLRKLFRKLFRWLLKALRRRMRKAMLHQKAARPNTRLLVDVRRVMGQRPTIPLAELLAGLAALRPNYETWSPGDLTQGLADLDIPVSKGKRPTVRLAYVLASCQSH